MNLERNRGRFVVFEGNDGSGKTTHSKRVVDLLQRVGAKVIWTREPGGMKELSPLRSLALDERVAADGLSQLFIFTTDRRLHLLLEVEPNLQAGTDVYCDRFDGSTKVYQHFVRGIPLATINLLNDLARRDILGNPEISPDLVILLDVDPEEGYRRTQINGRGATHFDREAIVVQRLRAEAYKELAAQYGWVIIDANSKEKEVFRNILLTLVAKGIINQEQIGQIGSQDFKEV